MSSKPGGPRLVGSVIDPSVGGETEPVFHPSEPGAHPAPSVASGVAYGPAPEVRRVSLPPLELPRAERELPEPPLSQLADSAQPPRVAAPPGALPEPLSQLSSALGGPAMPEPTLGTPPATAASASSAAASAAAQPSWAEPDAPLSSLGADFTEDDELPPVPIVRGQAMRERLLARVREMDPERARALSAGFGEELDQIGRDVTPPESPLERELDEIALAPPQRQGSSAIVRGKTGVSPTWIAALGGVFGVAIIASLVAVLMQVAPREFPEGVTPVAEVAPEATVEEAVPEPEKPPKRVKLPGPWRIADERGTEGTRIIEGEVGRESFLKAVQDAGLDQSQAYRALTALKPVRNLDKTSRTDRYIAWVDRSTKRLKAFEFEVSKEEVYQAKEDSSGLLRGEKLDLKVDRAQVKGAVRVSGAGFDVDAQRQGLEAGLAAVVSKALRGHMSIAQFKPGDVVKVVAQEVTVLGEFARYAGVEALEYLPAGSPEKAVRVYYFRGAKTKGYFDEKGRSPSEGGWRKPIPDAPVTSHFNPNRMHPVLKRRMPHNGTDFGAPTGTPIGASSYGVISFMGDGGPAGNLVMIKHDDDIETGYAHLSRFAEGLKVGQRVERMQTIGYCGSTGRSTGPHLHFIAKRKGQYIDALSLKLDALAVLPSSERAAFEEFKRQFTALFAEIVVPPLAEEPAAQVAQAASGDGERADDAPQAPAAPTLPAADVVVQPTGARPAGGAVGIDLSKASIHMSDEDLMKAQGLSDDGEVDE